ncbi:MAG: hypothetical protein Q9218_005070 [Villophora microphyllina]
MDPVTSVVTVSALILGALQYANSFYRLTSVLNDVDDPRIKMIKYKLLTQRQMVMAWANRVRRGESESWIIPPESARDVEQILGEMRTYFERAERKMDRIYRAPDGKMTSKIFVQRFWFSVGGHQEIRDLTEALDTMNRALLVIAPPLSSQARPGSTLGLTDADSGFSRHKKVETSYSEIIPAEGIEATRQKVPVSVLHRCCIDALGILLDFSRPDHKDVFADHCDLLKRWGSGLLTGGPLSLDAAFSGESDRYAGLEEIITKLLVRIAVIGEIFLRQLCENDTSKQGRLHRQHTQLLAILGGDRFNKFALECWTDMLARRRDLSVSEARSEEEDKTSSPIELEPERNSGEGPALHRPKLFINHSRPFQDLEHIEEETETMLETVVTSLSQSRPEETHVETIEEPARNFDEQQVVHLSRCIEFLFDLLPTIRRLRRQRLLEIEGRQMVSEGGQRNDGVAKSFEDAPNTTSTGKLDPVRSLDISFEQLLDHSLKLASTLDTILRNDELWARKNNQKIQAYSVMLKAEVDRLNAFKDLSATSKSLGEAEMRSVVDTIATLSETLHQAIKDVSVSEQPTSDAKDGSRFRLVDAKFAKSDVDKTIKAVIEQFAASNKAMWLQSTHLQPKVSVIAV